MDQRKKDKREDPYRSFRFTIEFDGTDQGGFSDVTGYDMSIDVVEYREGNEEITKRKLSGLAKYSNITLKRGITTGKELYDWMNPIAKGGETTRKNVSIKLNNEAGEHVATWQVVQAWPVKHTISEFKAGGNDVLIESLELAHEGMTREK